VHAPSPSVPCSSRRHLDRRCHGRLLQLVTSGPAASAAVATTAAPTTAAAPTTVAVTTTTVAAPTTTTSGLPGKLALYPKPIPGDLPDGVYAFDITDTDLAAVGEPNVAENHGHFVWTLAQGIWSYVQTADNPLQNPTDTGTYQVEGVHVHFFGATDDPGQDFVWVVNADGSLQLTYQASTTRSWSALLGSHPLVPVG
jgi:hypothetical protein